MQIFGEDEWYAKQATLSTAEKVQGWLSRKGEAIALGYAGLRGNGNTSFLDEGTWDEFLSMSGPSTKPSRINASLAV